jgi:hypothetical protein|nr:MAG TPA: hypothetical protein [Bacteriophage sp.]DAV94144.1 MAG TPA: hypothetical protein [Caudoviricetes sp.]DAZ42974.1 MAG TPA: hypothetical protein [Caudoviricetes sp.]
MACLITIAGITLDCESSLGGIKQVWITQYDNVKSVTVDDETNQISAITLEADAKWYNYQFRKGTGSLTSTLNVDETAGTNYVSNELALVFTKMETKKRIEIAALSIGQLVVVVEDSNGKYWFLGKDDYVSASAGTGVTGTAKGDQNAYTLTLATDSESYPYELSAEAIQSVVGA